MWEKFTRVCQVCETLPSCTLKVCVLFDVYFNKDYNHLGVKIEFSGKVFSKHEVVGLIPSTAKLANQRAPHKKHYKF